MITTKKEERVGGMEKADAHYKIEGVEGYGVAMKIYIPDIVGVAMELALDQRQAMELAEKLRYYALPKASRDSGSMVVKGK
jgi:hypothetical protein